MCRGENCWSDWHKAMVFVTAFGLIIHGLVGVFHGGFWIAYSFSNRVLFQTTLVDDPPARYNNKKNSETVAEITDLTTVKDLLRNIYFEPIDRSVIGALEVYLALVVCCASCCELKTLLRVTCGLCVLLMLHNIAAFTWAMTDYQKLLGARKQLEALLRLNFDNLFVYSVAKGSDVEARFTFEMNGLQVVHDCCGVYGYRDYANATQWQATKAAAAVAAGGGAGDDGGQQQQQLLQLQKVPTTCCRLDKDAYLFFNHLNFPRDCPLHPSPNNSHLHVGCLGPFLDSMTWHFLYFSLAWDVVSTALFALTMSLFYCQIREAQTTPEDPLEGLRDGRFFEETEEFAQQMSGTDFALTRTRLCANKPPLQQLAAAPTAGERGV